MLSAVRYFFENTSIHGLKYIAERKLHWTERVMWAFLVSFAFCLMILLILASYHNYKNHPVSFVVDTAYLRWNTDFPAISVCEKSSDRIYEVAERWYGKQRDMNLDLFLRDIAFFDGRCQSCEAHCEKGPLECPKDFSKIVSEVRSSCPELIGSCKWNQEDLDCCEYFQPMRTEMGPCFVFNSALDSSSLTSSEYRKDSKRRRRNFLSNRRSGPGTLVFQTKESVQERNTSFIYLASIALYLHSPYDVPYANLPLTERASVEWGDGIIFEFQVKEIENAVGVEGLDVSQRRCRFPWEKPDGITSLYKQYSYSTCVVECHTAAQLAMCNCTDHFMPTPEGWNSTCTTKGLVCVTKLQSTLRSLRTNWSSKSGLVCECDTGCMEPEYTIIQKTAIRRSSLLKAPPTVTIKMSALPSERFRRTIVRTRLDLVVSLGGTAGLFLGASLLSAVEIFYHLVFMAIHTLKKPTKPRGNPSIPLKKLKTNKTEHTFMD